jgi:hypothetical protein
MIEVEKFRIAYFPVPKCACSSAKNALYELANGKPYIDQSPGKTMHLHKIFPTGSGFKIEEWQRASDLGCLKICIVRDPLDRLRSAYTNRVIFHQEINLDSLRRASIEFLPCKPTFEEFADNLNEYQSIPSILHHTLPITHYLGEDSSRYDQIFNLASIEEFFCLLDSFSDRRITRYHRQNGGGAISVPPLSQSTLNKLLEYYKSDYNSFANYF